ncbi:two-component regulator propeller domain-containing protein [Ichthyenterobacterium sp. W332]|uniref:Two-component regulator propeller domain-containing protein n=1 Tax=Microcosmobacter mediterraneus TaxID=3075607 RepID=A0ABU2YII4_9FLAO|nr:two-component regulator propeller domain-containing protein [Ichthyenterobacterium sp. W332]MDT0557991.1 two-component regulator propeller domain-containing protein [Ichthyenterobacterium sp. W332]
MKKSRQVKYIIVVVGLLTILPLYSFAQIAQKDYVFKSITTEDGLSNNIVYDVLQDNDGYIWLATNNGLNRYDGYSIKTFFHSKQDSSSISSNVVRTIIEDKRGQIWIGTEKGLNRFNKKKQNFEQPIGLINFPIIDNVSSIALDKFGKIWISTAATISFFDPKSLEVELAYNIEDVLHIKPINEKVWINNFQGDIISYDTKTKKTTTHAKKMSNSAIDFGNHSKRLWVPYDFKTEIDTSTLRRFPKLPNNILPRHLLEVDAQKSLIGTNNGLFEYDYTTKILSKIPLGKSTLINQIRSLYKDNFGGIWVGTLAGVYHFDPYRKIFKHDDIVEESEDIIIGLHADNDGIYTNALGKGIYFKSSHSKEFNEITLPKIFPQQGLFVWDFETVPKSDFPLWMATNNGLICLDPKTLGFKQIDIPFKGKDGRISFSLLDTNQDFLWVSSHRAIHKIRKKDGILLTSFSLDEDIKYPGIQKIVRLKDYIFIATESRGLFSFHVKSHKFSEVNFKNSNGILNSSIWDLFVSGNTLWIGANKGLYKFSLGANGIVPVLEDNQVVFSIIQDDSGVLWMGSDKGIKTYETESKSVRYFTTDNGLKNPEFNRKSAIKTRDGRLWLGGVNGITSFDPSAIKKDNPNPPLVHITNLQVVTSDSTFSVFKAQKKLKLPWEHNTLEIEYVGLNYTNTSQNKYKYKMEGHDPNWVNNNEPSKARYVRLPVGTYTFKVLAANNDGKWNKEGDRIEIEISPPIWRTKTAYAIYALIFYGLIILFRRLKKYRQRIFQVEKEKEVIAKKVEEKFIALNNKTKVYLKDLKYIKAAGNYLEFHTSEKVILDRNKLKLLEGQLPPNFIRTHRSYIVNKNYITSANSASVFIKPNTETPLSRSFKGSLK